ncbi:MAG: hypothetical protein WBF52_05180 [Geitlerinemataceae cyanobacterium]
MIESQETLQRQIDELKKHCQLQSKSLESIEKKLQYLCAAADGEFAEIRQSLDRTDHKLSQKIELLEVDVQQQHRLLKLGLKKIKKNITEEQKQREYLLTEELYQYYNRILETKISRDEISDILLEICYKIEARQTLESNSKIVTENPN